VLNPWDKLWEHHSVILLLLIHGSCPFMYRYCIVIDDIWDEKTWEVIKNAFVDSNPRSRIIATTRNSKVSEEIGKVYRMEKLPES